MGTTAQKIQYLDGTKTLLKDTINLTGAGITNDTFRSYATKLKQGYLDILNNGIDTLYNNFPKVSGIGSNLSLAPTYEAPIKLNEIQGDTLQDGTPTPSSPVSIQSVTGLQNVTISNSDNTDSNTYEVNLGKNLLPFTNQDFSVSGINFYVNNGRLYVNGSTTGEIGGSNNAWKNNFSFILKPGVYTFSFYSTIANSSTIRKKSDNSVLGSNINGTATYSTTFTLDEETECYLGIYIYKQSYENNLFDFQLEKGSQASSHSPYFTPIELNKIGDYEDKIYKDNGKWYIYKEIGKIILDETTIFYNFRNVNNTYVNANYTNANLFKILSSNNEVGCISNKLLGTNVASTYGGSKLYSIAQAGNGNYLQLCLPYSEATSYSEVNEWISNNNPIVYYILETPTTTEITNTELIEQLETLYNAKSKNGTTNITITSEDLSMILNVSVLKGE